MTHSRAAPRLYREAGNRSNRAMRRDVETGQREVRITAPSWATRRAGRPSDSSHAIAGAPRTMVAVAAMLASRHVPADTVTVRHGPLVGRPVAGSMMWWSVTPPRVQ